MMDSLNRLDIHKILYELCFYFFKWYFMFIKIYNFNFLQLKMFEKMNFKVDHSNPIYKQFRLKVLGEFLLISVAWLKNLQIF